MLLITAVVAVGSFLAGVWVGYNLDWWSLSGRKE